jgi:hypothetical protein
LAEEKAMYIPGARERVFVAGQSGVYLVVWVDREKWEVDLIPLNGAAFVEENVPFSEIKPYREDGLDSA